MAHPPVLRSPIFGHIPPYLLAFAPNAELHLYITSIYFLILAIHTRWALVVFVLDGVLHTGLFSNTKREGEGGEGVWMVGWVFFLMVRLGFPSVSLGGWRWRAFCGWVDMVGFL